MNIDSIAIISLGGALLGAAAATLLVYGRRVAGVSGILEGVLRPTRGDWAWRLAFIAGLLGGGVFLAIVYPQAFPAHARTPLLLLLVGGVLVGMGARLGNGCTSGHGVCGIGRFSLRGIVATLTFMATGMLSVALLGRLV